MLQADENRAFSEIVLASSLGVGALIWQFLGRQLTKDGPSRSIFYCCRSSRRPIRIDLLPYTEATCKAAPPRVPFAPLMCLQKGVYPLLMEGKQNEFPRRA